MSRISPIALVALFGVGYLVVSSKRSSTATPAPPAPGPAPTTGGTPPIQVPTTTVRVPPLPAGATGVELVPDGSVSVPAGAYIYLPDPADLWLSWDGDTTGLPASGGPIQVNAWGGTFQAIWVDASGTQRTTSVTPTAPASS